jgi:hypothetical protein
MKAIEFETTLNSDKTLIVSDSVALNIPQGRSVRVLVLFADTDSDAEWEHLSASTLAQDTQKAMPTLLSPAVEERAVGEGSAPRMLLG